MMIGSLWIHSNAILNAIGPARLTHPDCSKRGTSLTPPMKDYSKTKISHHHVWRHQLPLRKVLDFLRGVLTSISLLKLLKGPEAGWCSMLWHLDGWENLKKQWRWVSDKQRYKTMLRWRVRNRWTEEWTSGSFGKARWWSHGSGQAMITFGGSLL